MKSYNFKIIASGLDVTDPRVLDRFFEAGCDDALIAFQKGRIIIEFDREARTFLRAVASAIAEVRSAGADAIRVEPDNLVSASEIAKRSDLGRAAISLYAKGERREDFPAPVARIATDQPLYDWAQVAEWLYCHEQIALHEVIKAKIIRLFNDVLAETQSADRITRKLNKLFRKTLGYSTLSKQSSLWFGSSRPIDAGTDFLMANSSLTVVKYQEALVRYQEPLAVAESLGVRDAA